MYRKRHNCKSEEMVNYVVHNKYKEGCFVNVHSREK